MVELKHESFLKLRQGARVVEADRHGEKVLLLQDGTYLKFFRRKRLFSSTAWYPYAQRFADNAGALAARGVPCPDVIRVYRLPSISRDAVHYRPLAGRCLRQLVELNAAEAGLRSTLGTFVARLHSLGVYFRSLHLGNVVLTPEGKLGLIDLADMNIAGRPLGKWRINRNMRHLFRLAADRAWLGASGGQEFLAGYCAASSYSPTLPIHGAGDQVPVSQAA